MALDNLTLEIITTYLKDNMTDGFITKPFALSRTDFALPFSRHTEEGYSKGAFIFSMNTQNPFVTISYDRYEKVEDNTPFFNSLKKLTSGKILSIEKVKGERVITIKIDSDRRDITQNYTSFDLIVELFPNHPNAYLISYPSGKILSLYKERVDFEHGLFLTRNGEYDYPQEREPLHEGIESLEKCKDYLSNFCYRKLSEYVEKTGDFKTALHNLVNSRELYLFGKNILPVSFDNPSAKKIDVKDMYSLLAENQKEEAKFSRVKELIELIEKSIKNSKRKLKNLQSDLITAQKSAVYLEYGQTIYLYQSEIEKGDTLLVRDGYEIPLEPKLDAVRNANRYFKKYSKAKTARTILQDLISKTEYEIEYLEKKLLEAKDGTPRDILELKTELLAQGYIKEKQGKKSAIPKISKKRSYDPHYIRTEQGVIGFGMNGLQNEELTFKIAKKDDLFFHVLNYPGSHVVILDGKDNPEVVKLALELSLYLSHLQSGEVMLTERKNIKKNPEKLGLVNILKYETLNVKEVRKESKALFDKELKKKQ